MHETWCHRDRTALIERHKDSVVPQFQDCAHMRCQSVHAGFRLQCVLELSIRLIEHVCPRLDQGSQLNSGKRCRARLRLVGEASEASPLTTMCHGQSVKLLGLPTRSYGNEAQGAKSNKNTK